MNSIGIDTLSKMINGKIIRWGKENEVSGVVIDSRLAKKRSVFFALDGTEMNGHDFALSAYKNGACAVVVKREIEGADCFQIKVEDTLKALYDMAKSYKDRFDIPFVALTGSAGKTTTKDMTASVLSKKYKTMKTIGNFNSTTGVPLTLFNLEQGDEIAVVEMGMNHKGEIEKISELVEPDLAMITNVGVTHIENLGSKENIFKAKTEITKGLKKGGTLLVNGDDEFFKDYTNDEFNVVKVGISHGDFRAADILYSSKGAKFMVDYNGKNYTFCTKIPAKYSVYNALFAIYTGFHFGLNYEQIKEGLDDFMPTGNRMKIEEVNGITLIDDTYNSNPEALKEALGLLNRIGGNNRKVAVLGDMLELGEKSEEEHEACGKAAAENGVELLLACGDYAMHYIKGAGENGMDPGKALYFFEKNYLVEEVFDFLKEGDFVLVKASRGMKFEDVVDAIKKGGVF